MAYINNNKIISLGGIKRAYLNNTLIFQSFAKVVAEQPKWVTLTQNTNRSIQMQTFRIDATDPQTNGYYFITFSETPNYDGDNADITSFSICPDEGTIYDNGSIQTITEQTHIEGNVYEYTFSVPVYFAGGEANAPLSQVQYKSMVDDIPEEELPQYDVTATFNVTNTAEQTALCYSTMSTAFTEMYIDGEQVAVTSGYTFSTTGEHTVNYMLKNNTILTSGILAGLFANCTSLEEIVITDSVTTIGDKVFQNCSSLKKITLGNGVTKVGNPVIAAFAQPVFSGCTNLKEITCYTTTAPTLSSKAFNGIQNNGGVLFVPQGSDYSSWISILTTWTIQYIT